MDKKPNVFPIQNQEQPQILTEAEKISAYEAEKLLVTNEIFNNAAAPSDTPKGHVDAVAMMRERTMNQMNQYTQGKTVQHPELAEKTSANIAEEQMRKRTEDQIKLRDEQLAKNKNQISTFQQQTNEASTRHNNFVSPGVSTKDNMTNYSPPIPPNQNPPYATDYGQNPSNINPFILELSQPNYNSPFDVIPLPSEGKLYRSKKPSIRIGYMTTADENILTSPNLLQSGEFLEILINRKILEPELRYKDLHIGDRNAIMLWLRATSYGEMYPVTFLDEKDVPFDTQVNLNDLKTKTLGAEPDEEGLFTFKYPLCKATIKFKLSTCGVIDEVERLVEMDKKNGFPIDNTNIYLMERNIVEVNGIRDRNVIKDFASSIRIGDDKEFKKYVDQIESGIELDIEIGTPGGGSIKTFLPLNINFFWPNFKL